MKRFNVEGFPSIYMVEGANTRLYSGLRTVAQVTSARTAEWPYNVSGQVVKFSQIRISYQRLVCVFGYAVGDLCAGWLQGCDPLVLFQLAHVGVWQGQGICLDVRMELPANINDLHLELSVMIFLQMLQKFTDNLIFAEPLLTN